MDKCFIDYTIPELKAIVRLNYNEATWILEGDTECADGRPREIQLIATHGFRCSLAINEVMQRDTYCNNCGYRHVHQRTDRPDIHLCAKCGIVCCDISEYYKALIHKMGERRSRLTVIK